MSEVSNYVNMWIKPPNAGWDLSRMEERWDLRGDGRYFQLEGTVEVSRRKTHCEQHRVEGKHSLYLGPMKMHLVTGGGEGRPVSGRSGFGALFGDS